MDLECRERIRGEKIDYQQARIGIQARSIKTTDMKPDPVHGAFWDSFK
jgi:hypothetical protein